ncbi:hypothetical protein GCM10011497_03630 [Elstera cyanobacteriorum]|uniref:CHAD domain-containing protein n=1 Tax=Elstera cyanobacteriorum TaxID=2022747 RepID=A0A255XNS7_9PROT|nr:CHAD domain-containing protein [Elstera cyanobacteriorum]OYQ18638.1 hypothetical protein CHR90_10240 [Elstera cyanobacteriorum]GFZ78882.1 hypothetical protein GCM10011497_03630 [Elstera cyanobacteriorum]
MSTLWLGLKAAALDEILKRPAWRRFRKVGAPETWCVVDTPDQQHRGAPLLLSPRQTVAAGLMPLFDLTRTRWHDGPLLLEHVFWQFPDGRTDAAVRLRVPVGAIEARWDVEALHGEARRADPIPLPDFDPVAEGYRRLGGDPLPKPEKLRLTPDMTAGRVLAAILDTVIEALLLHLPAVAWQQETVAIHQARVALRRLRAALPLFGAGVGAPERAEDLRRRAGDLARRLGGVRDLDVFRAETLVRAERDFPLEPGWANLAAVATARRMHEAGLLGGTITNWETTAFLLDVLRWRDEAAAMLPSGPAATEVARTLLADRWRRVSRQGNRLDRIDVPGLHDLRIKVKKLRYLIDFTKTIFDEKQVLAWENHLGALQDALGTLNDGVTARGLIHGMMPTLEKDGAFAAGLLIAWSDGRTLRHRNRIGKLWAEVADLPLFWEAST